MRLVDKFTDFEFNSYEDFYNNFKIKVPPNFNFAYDVVDEYAQKAPDQTALVWCNDMGEDKIFSFKDISDLSKKAANALKKLGVKKGDKVLLILKSRYQFWYLIIALCRLGAVAIPATHMLTKKDIAYRIDAADIKMVISVTDENVCKAIDEAEKTTHKLIKATVSGTSDGFIDMDSEVNKAGDVFACPTGEQATKTEDIMILYFTSGTTGMPKIVSHNFSYPLAHIITAGYWHNLDDKDLHFTLADTGWAKSSWGKLYGQWIMGAAVFTYDYETRFQPYEMAKMIEKYRITSFCAPPTIFRFLIKEDLASVDLSSLKKCCIAGESLNPEVYKRWLEITGIKLMEGYGQTETVVLVAVFPWIEPRPGSMGKPAPVFNVKLLNDKGEICEVGEEGEICVDMRTEYPIGLYQGYYREQDRTDLVMYDGFYHTGDVAWCDEDGYLWFVGRFDDIIKSSGYRIGPYEVESALIEHPAVLETAITAIPDTVRGQIVKATVVLAKGYTASEELKAELQNHVKQVTAPYKYPRIIEFVSELPKTISGKIRRVQIREEDAEK